MIEVAPSARPRMQARPSRPDPMITQLLFWGLLGAAAYLLYIHILLSFINYDRDENMYLGASYFVFHGMTIYRDFLYFQTPYLPYLYALIGGLLAGEDYYMAGKACSILFYAGTIVVCASYIYRQSASKILALSMVVLLLINPVMAKVGQVASNYILATFLSALSFLIYLRAISSKKNYIYFFVGALVGVSAGIKLYHITLIIPYAASFLIGSDNNASEKRGFFWLLAGFLFSLSPVFFLYFLYPESFLYSNLEYHWLAKGVFAIGMDGFIKSKIILRYFFNPSMLILAVCSTAAIFYLLLRWKEVRKEQFVAAAATATALATVVLPTPPHSEYLSYPIVLMCFLVGSCINKFHDFMVVKIFIIATMLSLVIHFYQKSSVLLSPHGIQAYKNAVEPYAKKNGGACTEI